MASGWSAATRFELGGVPVSVACVEPRWSQWISERFAGFLSDRSPGWRVSFEVTGPTPDFLSSPTEIHNEAIAVEGRGDSFCLCSETMVAEVDLGRRRARVAGPLATYPLDALLRHLLPLIVEDGLVVHAAMLAEGERGWACCGPSGSGKSTLAGLLPERAHCDELVAIRYVDDRWDIEALPFWQARPGRARLEAVYLLGHGSQHRRSHVTSRVAVRELVPQLMWPVMSSEAMERAFGLLTAVTATVPCWRLEFVPRADVLDVITAEG
jgi:hypothetical protein